MLFWTFYSLKNHEKKKTYWGFTHLICMKTDSVFFKMLMFDDNFMIIFIRMVRLTILITKTSATSFEKRPFNYFCLHDHKSCSRKSVQTNDEVKHSQNTCILLEYFTPCQGFIWQYFSKYHTVNKSSAKVSIYPLSCIS